MQIGYANARMDELALRFSEVVAYGEIAGPCNLDGLH
jgi:hypothetical protein